MICLGAIATHAILGTKAKVTELRGLLVEHEHFRVGVTVHPSAILRAPDRARAYSGFVDDLQALFAKTRSSRS